LPEIPSEPLSNPKVTKFEIQPHISASGPAALFSSMVDMFFTGKCCRAKRKKSKVTLQKKKNKSSAKLS